MFVVEYFHWLFFKRDLDNNEESLKRVVGSSTLYDIICEGLIHFIMFGETKLTVSGQEAANVIRYGIGFGVIVDNTLNEIKLTEPAIFESLRHLMPLNDLVEGLKNIMASCPQPQMVGYLLEYLVAIALVAKESGAKTVRDIKISQEHFIVYFNGNDDSAVYLPVAMCGPDVIYKCVATKTIYIVQIKFVKRLTKQEQVKACNTTDPKYFYCNRTDHSVLNGYEDVRSHFVGKLAELEKAHYSLKRMVVVHSADSNLESMANVEVINRETSPNFFDFIGTGTWDFLDRLRSRFM